MTTAENLVTLFNGGHRRLAITRAENFSKTVFASADNNEIVYVFADDSAVFLKRNAFGSCEFIAHSLRDEESML